MHPHDTTTTHRIGFKNSFMHNSALRFCVCGVLECEIIFYKTVTAARRARSSMHKQTRHNGSWSPTPRPCQPKSRVCSGFCLSNGVSLLDFILMPLVWGCGSVACVLLNLVFLLRFFSPHCVSVFCFQGLCDVLENWPWIYFLIRAFTCIVSTSSLLLPLLSFPLIVPLLFILPLLIVSNLSFIIPFSVFSPFVSVLHLVILFNLVSSISLSVIFFCFFLSLPFLCVAASQSYQHTRTGHPFVASCVEGCRQNNVYPIWTSSVVLSVQNQASVWLKNKDQLNC